MSAAINETIGRRVVASDTAEEIGEVKTFVISPDGKSVTQLQVTGRKRNAMLVDWNDVDSLGADVVMVSGLDRLHEPDDDRADDMVRGNIEFVGSRVVSTDGRDLGTVSDVHFDDVSGEVLALIGDGVGRVGAENIHSLGSYAAVVTSSDPAG